MQTFKAWLQRVRAVWSVAVEADLVLFICSLLAVFRVLAGHGHGAFDYALAMLPATVASMVFAVMALVLPGLLGDGKLAFPLNLTLPLIHTSCAWAVRTLVFGDYQGPFAMLDIPRTDRIWLDPRLLAVNLLLQFAALSAWAAWSSRGKSKAEA